MQFDKYFATSQPWQLQTISFHTIIYFLNLAVDKRTERICEISVNSSYRLISAQKFGIQKTCFFLLQIVDAFVNALEDGDVSCYSSSMFAFPPPPKPSLRAHSFLRSSNCVDRASRKKQLKREGSLKLPFLHVSISSVSLPTPYLNNFSFVTPAKLWLRAAWYFHLRIADIFDVIFMPIFHYFGLSPLLSDP